MLNNPLGPKTQQIITKGTTAVFGTLLLSEHICTSYIYNANLKDLALVNLCISFLATWPAAGSLLNDAGVIEATVRIVHRKVVRAAVF
jgi:hypothetical protein